MAHTQPRIGLAFAWSMVNNVVIRIGNFAVSIVVARLVAPEEFGVFAVALTVQTVLAALADLGLSAALIRGGRIREQAATATTVALIGTGLLALLMASTAGIVSTALGSPQATPIVALMSITLLMNGLAIVPASILQREFRQSAIFGIEAVGFVVATATTIVLLVLGFGATALVISRLLAQAVTCVLQYATAHIVPRLGRDWSVARELLGFGGPIAAANMLSWVVMNVDYMVVGNIGHALVLGLYMLAFNIASWPMTALGSAIRPVALPAFSRLRGAERATSLGAALALAWAAALLVGILFTSLAEPVIGTVYGQRWLPAAAALGGLALFGAMRVVIDLTATFLVAAGANKAVLLVQVVWLVALAPAMVVGVREYGLAGAGWAHVVVGAGVVLPAYAVALRKSGASLRPLLRPMIIPVAAAVPATVVAVLVGRSLAQTPVLALIAGGTAGSVTYLAPLATWLIRHYRALRASGSGARDLSPDLVAAPG